MSHYEERLERDLDDIRSRVRESSAAVEQAVQRAVHALLTHNIDLANEVILGDLPINRAVRATDSRCHAFVARHLPSAGHLRTVSAILRLNIELERVGDYAVTVAREVVQLSEIPPEGLLRDVELIGDQARATLSQAVQAFLDGNAELARGTKKMAQQVDKTFQKVFADLLRAGERGERPIKDLFALLVIINRLGRVSDQAKNVCEDTLFAVAGETKAEKVYRVLFLDAANDSLSQIAQGYASKAFPESGRFDSFGWSPAQALDPRAEGLMERKGLDLAGRRPRKLDATTDDLSEYHVIVALEPGARKRIGELPFRTVLLEWPLGPLPKDLDAERTLAALEQAYETISVNVRDLMDTLRGDTA
ncbi:MAG: phosphate signaling complex protein PhoU [Thermoanaerobaculia bacterium]|nr:phosphate signaling complex protein PhoU [Thermoanaerobaculia bacterium]